MSNVGLTINGYTYPSSDIGSEITFTPVAADVGKVVGRSQNYNPSSITPWWKELQKYAPFTVIPVCWSGASISSHEKNDVEYKTSYAWHDAQIRKCGVRVAGTMTRNAPDIIIVYRGLNDFSHSPYTRLTPDYYNEVNWNYPNDDYDDSNYGFKEAIAIMINKLRTAYPTSKIVLCTLFESHRANNTHFPVNNGVNNLEEYNNAIREAADFYGCGLIDFAKSGITFENASTYCRDNPPVHPNNDGHFILAMKAYADLNAIYQ